MIIKAPAFAVLLSAVYAQGTWTTAANDPNGPAARSGAAKCFNQKNGLYYEYSGIQPSAGMLQVTQPLNDLWVLNPVTVQWTDRTPSTTPGARSGMLAAANPIDGMVYFYGGLDGSNTAQTDLWRYSPTSGVFSSVLSTKVYQQSKAQWVSMAINSANGNIYFFDLSVGGAFGLWTGTSQTLKTSTNPPGTRSGYIDAVDNVLGRYYISGGTSTVDYSTYFDIWYFGFSTFAWTQVDDGTSLAAQTYPRLGMTVHPYTGDLLFYGGNTDTGLTSQLYAYDVNTTVWTLITDQGPNDISEYGMGVHYPSGTLVLALGHSLNSNGYVNEVFTYSFDISYLTSKPSRYYSLFPSSYVPSSTTNFVAASIVSGNATGGVAPSLSTSAVPASSASNAAPTSAAGSGQSSVASSVSTRGPVGSSAQNQAASSSPIAGVSSTVPADASSVVAIAGSSSGSAINGASVSRSTSSVSRAFVEAGEQNGGFVEVISRPFFMMIAGAIFIGLLSVMVVARVVNLRKKRATDKHLDPTMSFSTASATSKQNSSFASSVPSVTPSMQSTINDNDARSAVTAFTTQTASTNRTLPVNQEDMGLSIPAFLAVQPGSDFRARKQLGKGGFGVIEMGDAFKQSLKVYGERIIIKRMGKEKPSELDQKQFFQEIAIMYFLKDQKNIAKVIGYSENPYCILMKFYERGSIDMWMKSRKTQKTTKIIFNFLQDIASGLRTIHDHGFVHYDLKPHNILIDDGKERPFCVITDFGITQIVSNKVLKVDAFQVVNINGVSMFYAAPEVMRRVRSIDRASIKVTPSSDVYSYGILMMEMITRRVPWLSTVGSASHAVSNFSADSAGTAGRSAVGSVVVDTAEGSVAVSDGDSFNSVSHATANHQDPTSQSQVPTIVADTTVAESTQNESVIF